mgnify:CR=1 FL=1
MKKRLFAGLAAAALLITMLQPALPAALTRTAPPTAALRDAPHAVGIGPAAECHAGGLCTG